MTQACRIKRSMFKEMKEFYAKMGSNGVNLHTDLGVKPPFFMVVLLPCCVVTIKLVDNKEIK